jgi:hypothetical protein
MHELWKNQPPPDRAPVLTLLTSDVAKKEIAAGSEFTAQAGATDPDGDPLSYQWTVSPESSGRDKNGKERPTKPLPECVIKAEGSSAAFQAPTKPGDYRVHVRVTDTHQRAATANFPMTRIIELFERADVVDDAKDGKSKSGQKAGAGDGAAASA